MRRQLYVAGLIMLLGLVPVTTQDRAASDVVARIRTEGQQRSQALALYRTLTDDIGARLTGSPAHVQAARWARDRFTEWGLANPHLEPYEFGHGWQLERISVEMTAPRYLPLIAYADAWSPSTVGVVSGRAVYVGDKTASQIQAMAAQLRGAIVLTHLPQTEWVDRDRPQPGLDDRSVATGNPTLPQARSTTAANELMPLLSRAGTAVALRPSAYRDGTVGVTGNRATRPDSVPSIVVAGEQYNVLARLAAGGHPVSLRVELRTRYLEDDRNSYNVVADIPGRDAALRDQVVLMGGHLDSWHTASGGTDNADGAVAVMEAMRILGALGAQPRRTIRAALWSGEEQGLLGARAYLAQHFGTPAARDQLAVYLNDSRTPDGAQSLCLGTRVEYPGAEHRHVARGSKAIEPAGECDRVTNRYIRSRREHPPVFYVAADRKTVAVDFRHRHGNGRAVVANVRSQAFRDFLFQL